MSLPFLSIVIPAFNERERLPKTLKSMLEYLQLQSYTWEILVVDDGSSDGTAAAIEMEFPHPQLRVLRQAQNYGKGAAVRAGMLASRGQQVVFSDADGSTPITELPKLQAKLADGAHVAIGNRRDSALVVKQPFYRVFVGETFNLLARIALATDIRDTQCGFKLLDGEVGRQLFGLMKMDGFSFDVELLYLALKQGYRVVEVPVIWIDDTRSKVNVVRDSFLVFIDLIQIRLLHP